MSKKILESLKRAVTMMTVVATILWSVGISVLIPQAVYAATVTAAGPYELLPTGGMQAPASSFDIPVIRFSLKHAASDSGNTLSTVTVTVTSTVATNNATLASHITQLVVFRDSNSNNIFDPQNDGFAGTQSTVNVGAPTTVTVSANNSIAANEALPTSFFVAFKTAAGWAAGDSVYINMAANGIATSGVTSPTVTALTGTKAISFGGGGGWGGFSVSSVTYVNATTVDVSFTDFLDLNTGVATTTGNYTLTTAAGGDNSTITSVTLLSDNKSVRVAATGAQIASTCTDTITVTNAVKNTMGMANANISATPIMGGTMPLVISEVKIGATSDTYDEFLEIYNRSAGSFPTSSLKLHIVNAAGTSDTNMSLTYRGTGNGIPAHGFLLIAPASSTLAALADATYTTSTVLSLVANGALYISNSAASSTSIIDRFCWGTHSVTGDCEGSSFSALAENGTSAERKAFNDSTFASMVSDTNGNGIDTQNNSYDFVARATPQAQNTGSTAETPTGGSYGGASNQAPNIMAAPIFRASSSSTFDVVARISDDGGPLPAANTQLIFCVDDINGCRPNSSTPIYGTSIGSGWYKFTPTTTPWSNYKSYFRYYLQATDSATPAKSRVFTNDPSYDMNTYDTTGTGIQTQVLQIAKAFSVNVVAGNLGTASISGTVNNSSSVAVSGATVWIDGTQFAATTGNDGSFSFSNVGPSGGVQIKVARDGYMDQSISTFLPPTGVVSLGTITLYSGTMGQGGDYTMPRVASSFPMPGMMGFPTQSPSGGVPTMDITFSKAMDTTTIIDTDASDAGSSIYLTEAGSSGTKMGGSVAMISGSTTQVRFTPTATLTAGRGYTLFLTPGVKDTAGNPISGNGPGGAYVLMFSTASGMFSTPGDITGFGTGNSFPPYVIGSQPAPGKSNAAINTKTFVTFSEALQNTAANLANVKLYKVANPYTASESKSLVTATNSLDTANKIIIVSSTVNLDPSSSYRVDVLGGLASAKGITMGNPGSSGYATNVMYKSDFQTGTTTDSTAPTIAGTIPAASATSISTIKPIVISFSEAMDPATITDTSVLLKLGSTAMAGTLTYDSNSRTATIIPSYALTASSTYTINVTTDVKDLTGQALATALLRIFTTGSADTSNPNVVSAQASDFSVKVTYSQPMLSVTASDSNYAYSVLNKDNYTIKRVNGATGATDATITLTSAATLAYDSASRSVTINSVSGFATGNFANVTVSNVKDIGFNTLATGGNAATTTAQSSAKTGGFMGGMGMGPMMDASGAIMQGGMMGGPPPMVGTFVESGIGFAPGVKVYPFNKMAGVSTIYGVEAPISYQVPNAGFIDITFPEGTDVTNAKKDPYSPPNNDLNGPGSGTVVFGAAEGTLPNGFTTGGQSADGVIVNATTRVVRVILGAVATRRGTGNETSGAGDQHDFLRLDIAQVVNSTISAAIDGSGNTATVETKQADGASLETLSSTAFFTNAAGSFTLRGHATTTSSGINGINIFLMSPMSGPMSSSSANGRYGATDGEFMFQNLVAGTYMLGADQFAKSGVTSYVAGFPKSVTVSTGNCPASTCTADVSLVDASSGATVILNISGTFSNQAIDIFAGGPGSFRKATSTLNGVLAGDTNNSIRLNTNGVWMVGFGPQMSNEMFGKSGPAAPSTWMPPKPQEVLVTGCPSACAVNPSTITFNVTKANNTVKYTVKDASGNAIGNAHVFAYSPSGGFGIDSSANADGTGSISMATGTYKIGADVMGMPSSAERSITVKNNYVYIDGSATGVALASMANADLVLTISKPSYTISGRVTDGTNAVAGAPVNAYRTDGPGMGQTFTNSSGDYTIYVNAGTWKVQAFTPDYGKLPEKTVTISSASVTGQNFEPNTASVTYASITKSVGNDTDADGVLDSGEGTSNVQILVEGTTGDLNNDGDTVDSGENTSYINMAVTDTNGSSTLKLPPGSYTMKAWSPTQGTMSSTTQSIVVNGAGQVATAPYDVLAPAIGTVVVNFWDENGNATTTSKAAIEFMQIGGKVNKADSFSGVASSTISLPIYDVAEALNSVTSTNPTNVYLMRVVMPGISQVSLNVYGGGSTIMATSTAASGAWKVEIDGNETINIKLPALKYVNGTVKDESGNAVPDATVHLENVSTGETIEVTADTSGNYSTKLSSGTYLMQADKDGYVDTATTVSVTGNGAIADAATTMTAASRTITGTITAGSAVASGATVRAEKLGGGVVTATTVSNGTYTLNVTDGDWKVSASADGYTERAYTSSVLAVGAAGRTSIDITLSTTASLAGAASQSVTPQNGGTLSDTSANMSINATESAIAGSANSYTLNEKETSNVVGGGSGSPIAGEAKTIIGYDNDGSEVSVLNKDVAVGIAYSNSEMTTTLGVLSITNLEKVKMASWDGTTDNWQHLPTTVAYKDSSGNYIEPSASAATIAYTGQTSHFSVFNPINPSDGLAPAAPANVAAVAGNATVTITWTAPTTNADGTAFSDLLGYEIYRSTSVGGTYTQLNISDLTSTSYADSTAVNGQTYYYKVTAADTGGVESSMSVSNAASPVQPASGSGASAAAPATPVLSATPVIVSGGATVNSSNIVLKFNVSDAVQMTISESSDFVGASWESYITTKAYTLSSGLGAKKLYIKFRSSQGGISDVKTVDLNVVSAPAGEPTTPSTTLQAVAPAAEMMVNKPESKVTVSNVPAVSFQPGAQLKFTYQYQNESVKKVTVKVVRQLVNSKGKVVRSARMSRRLKAGAVLKVNVKDVIVKTLPAGEYTVKVKILSATNKVLDENSFGITVEKLKKKFFTLGEATSADSPIVFDAAALAKVKSNVVLPVTLKLKYSYTNNTDKKQQIKMVRELVSEDGKVKASRSGRWVMKVGEKDAVSLKQPVASNLGVGSYTLRLRALDWKTKEVLAENSLGFAVETR